MTRLIPLRRKVELLHDGDLIAAEWGEPLSHALIAADRLVLARSPKLHRPRAPYCLRAACDGCLVRVDGVPNVMACRHAVTGGENIETQNVLGSREVDLLAATDFFFPHGIDHHRLFAGVGGVSAVLQKMARRIAGLGRLPDQAREAGHAEQRECDVLVVGGGAAGLAVARELGARSLVIDEERELGGALRLLEPEKADAVSAGARASGARLEPETVALGVYPESARGGVAALLSTPQGLCLMRARRLVIATGGHARLPPFPGNDLPGVFSVRAGLSLLRAGVLAGERVAVVGAGELAARARSEFSGWLVASVPNLAEVRGVEGRARVKALLLSDGEEQRRVEVDTVLFAADESPAFELAVQAGAHSRFEPARGYVPVLDEHGEAAPLVHCVGYASGGTGDPLSIARALTTLDGRP